MQKHGIKSTSIKIKPGQCIILPHGKYHCFKKIIHEPCQNEDTIPLVSCACDASFIGIDNVWNNYQMIQVCFIAIVSCLASITYLLLQRSHQIFKIKYSLYELGLLCLFKICQSITLDKNSIICHHAKGGLPLFKQWIDEQKRLLDKLGNPNLVADVNRMEEEIECNLCNNPISNFFTTAPKNQYLCLKCSKKKSRGNSTVHYRIFDINTADKLYNKVNNAIQMLNVQFNRPISMNLENTGELLYSAVYRSLTCELGIRKRKNSTSSTMPVKKRRRNNTNENVAQQDTRNNNNLEKEIEIFIP